MEELNIPPVEKKKLHEIVSLMVKNNYSYNEETIKEIIIQNYNLM